MFLLQKNFLVLQYMKIVSLKNKLFGAKNKKNWKQFSVAYLQIFLITFIMCTFPRPPKPDFISKGRTIFRSRKHFFVVSVVSGFKNKTETKRNLIWKQQTLVDSVDTVKSIQQKETSWGELNICNNQVFVISEINY